MHGILLKKLCFEGYENFYLLSPIAAFFDLNCSTSKGTRCFRFVSRVMAKPSV